MKFFVKKSAPKNAPFTAIHKSALKQVKGGTGVASLILP